MFSLAIPPFFPGPFSTTCFDYCSIWLLGHFVARLFFETNFIDFLELGIIFFSEVRVVVFSVSRTLLSFEMGLNMFCLVFFFKVFLLFF